MKSLGVILVHFPRPSSRRPCHGLHEVPICWWGAGDRVAFSFLVMAWTTKSDAYLASDHGYVLPMLLINTLERCKDDEGFGDSARRRNDLRYSVLRFEGRIDGRRPGVRRTFPQIALRLGDWRPLQFIYAKLSYSQISFDRLKQAFAIQVEQKPTSTRYCYDYMSSLMEVFTLRTRVRDVQKAASSLDARELLAVDANDVQTQRGEMDL
ncbi:hypothetical protein VNO77_37770 [Canavalia gladiata]|uniref:Uncharacterized protein n=1 Tax=Canavalia gladiata TaxID=3824 RepID=A0AAN9PXA1_CANGL